MDYRIVEKSPFTVVGKSIQVSTRDGENTRRIPQFWAECHQDGTVGRLSSIAPDKELLGICTDMQHDKEQFTYLIAVEAGAGAAEEGLISRSIPAASWAVFPSVGPLPGAIQTVWARIYQEWFPATGYEHGEGPELEVYPLGDISSEDYHCEVWVPVVKR